MFFPILLAITLVCFFISVAVTLENSEGRCSKKWVWTLLLSFAILIAWWYGIVSYPIKYTELDTYEIQSIQRNGIESQYIIWKNKFGSEEFLNLNEHFKSSVPKNKKIKHLSSDNMRCGITGFSRDKFEIVD